MRSGGGKVVMGCVAVKDGESCSRHCSCASLNCPLPSQENSSPEKVPEAGPLVATQTTVRGTAHLPRLIDLEQPIEHPRYQPPQLRKRQRRRPVFSPAWPPASGTRSPPATAPDDDATPPRCVPGSPQGPLRSYHPSSTVRSDDPPGTPARTPATIPPLPLATAGSRASSSRLPAGGEIPPAFPPRPTLCFRSWPAPGSEPPERAEAPWLRPALPPPPRRSPARPHTTDRPAQRGPSGDPPAPREARLPPRPAPARWRARPP